jgi:CheY-like chemotaxis protein
MSAARALLIDDDVEDRDLVRWHLEDAGMEVVTATGPYDDVQQLVDLAIEEDVDITICDHRLQPHRMANFYGAAVVARLTGEGRVAILITSYQESDAESSIRQHRRFVPAVVARRDLEETETFNEIVRVIRAELEGHAPLERQLYPTVIRVGSVATTTEGRALDVFVDGWRPGEAVRIPPALVPEHIAAMEESDLLDAVFAAEVNTAAKSHEELYFGLIEGPISMAEWPVEGQGMGNNFPTREGFDPIRPLGS